MPTYSANDIVGKTLIAKKNIDIKRLPSRLAPTVYTVRPGNTVGVVYSWIQKDGYVWWMMYDEKGQTYYVIHEPGAYDVGAINAQGAVSLETIQEQQAAAESPVNYYVSKLVKPIAWGAALYFGIKILIDLEKSSR